MLLYRQPVRCKIEVSRALQDENEAVSQRVSAHLDIPNGDGAAFPSETPIARPFSFSVTVGQTCRQAHGSSEPAGLKPGEATRDDDAYLVIVNVGRPGEILDHSPRVGSADGVERIGRRPYGTHRRGRVAAREARGEREQVAGRGSPPRRSALRFHLRRVIWNALAERLGVFHVCGDQVGV